MKYFNVLIVVLVLGAFVSGCSKYREIDKSQTSERMGLIYDNSSSEPYTGKVVSKYNNGETEKIESYKNGELVGKIDYYESGQIALKRNFKDGKLSGKFIAYYESGKIKLKGNYKDGRADVTMYDENGRSMGTKTFKDDN